MSLHRNVSLALKDIVRATLPKSYMLQRDLRKQLENGEPELKVVPYLCRRSEISIDVGANTGTYAYLFSQYSDQVIAVEPHPRLADRLKRLLPASVKVLSLAASNQDGVSEFYVPAFDGREIHTRSSLEADVNREMICRTILVEKRRLDQMPLGSCLVAVIKIDVEGHELSTLQGLVGILERSKPTIIVESEARHHAEAPYNVFSFLHSFGYQGYFVHRANLQPLSEFSVEKFQVETAATPVFSDRLPDYVTNFIFIHPSRSDVLDGVRRVFPFAMPQLVMTPAHW